MTTTNIIKIEDKIRKIRFFYSYLHINRDISTPSEVFIFNTVDEDLLVDAINLLGYIRRNNGRFLSQALPTGILLKILKYNVLFENHNIMQIKRIRVFDFSRKYTYKNVFFMVNRKAIDYVNNLFIRLYGTPIIEVKEDGEI